MPASTTTPPSPPSAMPGFNQPAQPPADAWIDSLGMFSGDELMKEVDAEGERIRREQRPENDSAV